MQVIADRAGVAYFTFAAFFGDRRGNAVFVDIETQIEFQLSCGVFCLFDFMIK